MTAKKKCPDYVRKAMDKIEQLRREHGYTYAQLAERSKVSVSTLRRWQRAPSDSISTERIVRVCKALEIDMKQLFDDFK